MHSHPPLKILQITQHLDIGGLETLVIDLAAQLHQKDIPVEVLCLNNVDKKYTNLLEKNGIPLHVIPRKKRMNPAFFIKAASLIRKKHFSILHAHSGCHIDAATLKLLCGNKRLIYTAHGLPIFRRIRDRIEDSFSACMTDIIIAVSDEIENDLHKWLLCPVATKFKTVINGIDTVRFHHIPNKSNSYRDSLLKKYGLPRDTILFGSVGRLEKIKNYEMLLRSAQIVFQNSSEDCCCVLVGDGNQRTSLESYAEQLNIREKVIFPGMQYAIHEILPLFQIFSLSSVTEGTSISLLEAQACGLPAVVTDVGGNGRVIKHGQNGFLCEVNNDKAMAAYILRLIKSRKLREKMSAHARKNVEDHFSIERMTDRYVDIYMNSVRKNIK